jgi:hypothetical protein
MKKTAFFRNGDFSTHKEEIFRFIRVSFVDKLDNTVGGQPTTFELRFDSELHDINAVKSVNVNI